MPETDIYAVAWYDTHDYVYQIRTPSDCKVSGWHWFPWIHMEDLIRIYETAITDAGLSGPVNACAPEPVRFHAFLDHIRQHRKAVILPVPVSLIGLFAKELIRELTNSQRIVSTKLNNMQFRFSFGNLQEALKAVFA